MIIVVMIFPPASGFLAVPSYAPLIALPIPKPVPRAATPNTKALAMAIPKNIHRPAAWADPSLANALEAIPRTNTAVDTAHRVLLDM
jgi:hypothetical protein